MEAWLEQHMILLSFSRLQASLKSSNEDMARGVRMSAGLRSALSVAATLVRSGGERGEGGYRAMK